MWTSLRDIDQLETLLDDSSGSAAYTLILKHSNRCAFSAMAKNRIERRTDERMEYYLLDVLANRDVSNRLAEITDTKHESPQAFLFDGSDLLEVKSHMAIDPAELSRRLDVISSS